MPKGYWIANVTVTDPQRYADYQALASEALAHFGARFLARGGERTALEGRETPERSVVMEFSSYQQALDCYHSPAYQRAKSARQDAADVDIVITEGL
ncbi:Uncharacterized conserved protein, DUF1330 family [Modicisalibacter muralis]|uniref:Uncharacterized conserved protein, DUF1330 family n=1 Tax=Modicisalibacter muralis TaxID=119000 RepID=A0A1G9GSY7_9GAMM|nr:DUF1330 domain-containing protein [Halomonas muralis]SDL03393.1 Uncharacterized conserved protein, DUF1330 family [Halomonas muralis]